MSDRKNKHTRLNIPRRIYRDNSQLTDEHGDVQRYNHDVIIKTTSTMEIVFIILSIKVLSLQSYNAIIQKRMADKLKNAR